MREARCDERSTQSLLAHALQRDATRPERSHGLSDTRSPGENRQSRAAEEGHPHHALHDQLEG
eukprot:12022443-Alexandrium_andersonii.AAC.1